MKCPVCREEIKAGVKYCNKCGTEIARMTDNLIDRSLEKEWIRPEPEKERKISIPEREEVSKTRMEEPLRKKAGDEVKRLKRIIWIACAVFAVVVIGLVFVLVRTLSSSRSDNGETSQTAAIQEKEEAPETIETTKQSTEQNGDESKEPEELTGTAGGDEIEETTGNATDDGADEGGKEIETTEGVNDHVTSELGIDPSTVEDYSACLNPYEYGTYTSKSNKEFSFSYPLNLFCDVKYNLYGWNSYGDEVETVAFSGDNGSELIFSYSYCGDDGWSIEENAEWIRAAELSNLNDAVDIFPNREKDPGKVVVTGWLDSSHNYSEYVMFRVDDEYIYQMRIIQPKYLGDVDETQKQYVTECLYRMCRFSHYDKYPRTFEEFSDAK